MKAFVYVDADKIGEVILEIIDESMGVIGGQLFSNENYEKYKYRIQQQCAKKSISNSTDFNYKIVLSDDTPIMAQGGIGVTDIENFDEKYIEIAGVNEVITNKFKKA